MCQRNVQQNIHRIHTEGIVRESHLRLAIRTIRECEQRRLVGRVLRPVDESLTVRVEIGYEIYESITELARVGAVSRMGVADVEL